ncbi:BMP family lipoprotein [Naumannella cuiyingiana]|uniref:Basic membrane protein A n=1 Tax=Naumannella cuiyingiana TaxID=1347891 RepID=A0A7Z0D7G3_9ACTN|nr:BMP family ABC transporter substrate-binding protein [Naumannella cuiyingiana]NYI70289.1 basic membrane protein A [Naumannella cuiyingiana]
MKQMFAVCAAAGALTLALAGCAQPPGQNTAEPGGQASQPSAGAADFKACMVSDSGGFDDKSFNQTSYKGLTDAAAKLGIQTGEVESTNTADFAQNIQSMIDADCNIVITVGFLLSDDTLAAAKANPDVDFAIVDAAPEGFEELDNLKPLEFNTAESSFLAGYLAAGMSKTGKVGTFGGTNIPTVTIFMDGYAQGVQHFNTARGAKVEVLGWNSERQDGQFVPGDNPFENVQGGQQTAQNLIAQGADVIMPVAGPAGEGALQAVQGSGGNASAIWVDTDGCVSAPNYCPVIVSSVYKGMDVAVEQAITDSQAGTFSNEPYIGTLENDGTGLSPFNDFESKVPAELKTELDTLRGQIISGEIKITSKAQPKG